MDVGTKIDAVEIAGSRRKAVEPFGDTVVFRALDADRTSAGLYVPAKGAGVEKLKRAIVIAVGPGRLRDDGTREPMPCAVGDQVVLHMTAPSPGQVMYVEHEEIYICRAGDIAGRIVDEPPELEA